MTSTRMKYKNKTRKGWSLVYSKTTHLGPDGSIRGPREKPAKGKTFYINSPFSYSLQTLKQCTQTERSQLIKKQFTWPTRVRVDVPDWQCSVHTSVHLCPLSHAPQEHVYQQTLSPCQRSRESFPCSRWWCQELL